VRDYLLLYIPRENLAGPRSVCITKLTCAIINTTETVDGRMLENRRYV